jgi:hypothetical protein
MSFEKRVLSIVSKVFDKEPVINSRSAYFEYGTLFLEDVSNDTGKKIIKTLEKTYKINYNIYNPINGFVIDFIA